MYLQQDVAIQLSSLEALRKFVKLSPTLVSIKMLIFLEIRLYVVSRSAHLCPVSAKHAGEQRIVLEAPLLAPCSCYSQSMYVCMYVCVCV